MSCEKSNEKTCECTPKNNINNKFSISLNLPKEKYWFPNIQKGIKEIVP